LYIIIHSVANIIRAELDLVIRSKVILVDPISLSAFSGRLSLSVLNGILTITYQQLFTLMLTLQHCDISSNWTVLSFSILSTVSSFNCSQCSYDFSSLEADVLQILRNKTNQDTATSTSNTAMKHDLKDSSNSQLMEVDSFVESNPPVSCSLIQLVTLCRHVSISASLRLLFLQSLNFIATVAKNFLHSSFVEETDSSSMIVNFWLKRSGYSSRYLNNLTI